MAKKKKLRMKNYMNHNPVDSTLENAVMEWQVPDDITIVGAALWAECSTGMGGAIRMAEISLAGTWSTDVDTAGIEQESDKKTILFAADKGYRATDVGFLPQASYEQIWFGKELGIDIDENEFIYIHQYGTLNATGMTKAIIYYIER